MLFVHITHVCLLFSCSISCTKRLCASNSGKRISFRWTHFYCVCVFFIHFIHLLLLLWRRRCQWQMPPWRNAWPFPMQLINDRLEFSHFSFLFLPHSLRSICHLFAWYWQLQWMQANSQWQTLPTNTQSHEVHLRCVCTVVIVAIYFIL